MANEDKKIVTVEGLEKVREKLDERYVIEGEYSPNTSVGLSRLAENLTPYSAESGTEQDIPFISQGTGCGNGVTQVDTGSYAQATAKKGNVVVANQLIPNTQSSTTIGGEITVTNNGDGTYTLNGTATADRTYSLGGVSNIVGHILFFGVSTNNITGVYIRDQWTYSSASAYAISTSEFTYGTAWVILIKAGTTCNNVTVRPLVIDLTLMHGNNAWIPADLLSHPENFFRYYQGSLAYDTGSFVHANGRYIVTTGRSIWDEQWELGEIDADGNNIPSATQIRSKNYIRVIPNTTYYFRASANYNVLIAQYGNNKTQIKQDVKQTNNTFTTDANTNYIRFHLAAAYGSVYNHDITLSLYYSGESGYNEYYPYEELDNIDTGTEDLLQAGEASDTKAKDGTITHNLVEINLSEKTWTLVEEVGYWYFVGSSPSNIRSVGSANLPNARSDKYVTVKMNDAGLANNTFAIDTQFILVRTSSTSVTPTGTIIAELDEPTTEQGTPYESTLNINDFGTMYWLTNGNATPSVPQGIEIFYPVDYKAFVDTLYNHTEGDATNLVVQSDLATSESVRDSVDTQLKNALGGALRQQLATKETLDFLTATNWCDLGELTWAVDNAENHRFSTTKPVDLVAGGYSSPAKMICTKYQVGSWDGTPNRNTNMTIVAYQSNIIICDTNFVGDSSGVALLKASLKGVLLAYEKA